MIFIEVDFLVPKGYQYGTVESQDQVRQAVEDALKWLSYEKWLTISFTVADKWAE